MMKEKKFKKLIEKLRTDLSEIKYSKGDIGDIGNEIGFSIGKHLNSEKKLNSFIHGIRHGISLVDGTHV